MDNTHLKVLLVEDDEDDYIITRDLLSDIRDTKYELTWISSYREALRTICLNEHDVYLFDFRLGENTGLDLLKEAVSKGCRSPMILLTGQGDRETDMEAMKSGASDYLIKSEINTYLLERSIRYSIERKNHEAALNRAKEEAESANRAKSHFLANMSHEIRTPINAILGFSDVLKESSLDTSQKECLETITSSSEILLNLINDILDLSKIESGDIELEAIDFDLGQLSESVLKITKPALKNHDLKVVYEVSENMPLNLRGDPTRIQQIILNLLSNAIKFTHQGEIKLTLSTASAQDISNENNIYNIKICVSDTGIGISSENHKTIFNSFVQEDSSITRQYGGTGLGLTIVKRLAVSMGGNVHLESKPGQGSKFTVIIPLYEGSDTKNILTAESETVNRNNNGDSLHGAKILLVEDNAVNLKLATRLLEKFGCNIDISHNGKEAIVQLKESTYDIVLMDIQMPVMGGLEATEIIRKELKNDIPIIALTAMAMEGDKESILAAGINDYLAKPIKSSKLRETLLKWHLNNQSILKGE